MTRKNALITVGLVIIAIAIPVTLLLGSRMTSYFGGAQQSPNNAFQAFLVSDQAFGDVCPSDASCSPFQYYYDCVAFGHIVAKVVDVTSGQEVDITNQYNDANRLTIDTERDKSKLWTARIDENINDNLSCDATGRIGAYWGGASCNHSGLLNGGSTYTTGKPVSDTNLWCFNGPFELNANIPSDYELVNIEILDDARGDEEQGGTVDLSGKKVKNINLCNYSYGPGNYFQMTQNYKFIVKKKVAAVAPVCILKTVPNPPKGTAPFKVSFDGSESTDSDGTITKYVWKIGDTVVSDQNKFDYTFNAAGKYAVTLVVEDSQGLTSPACAVEVEATTTPVANNPVCIIETVPSPAQGDAPLAVQFDGSKSIDSDGTITKYSWKIAGAEVATTPTFSRTFTEAGTYEVSLQVSDNQNLTSDICKVTVSPKQKDNVRPVCKIATIPTNPNGKVPKSVSFDGTGSTDADGSVSKYTWTLRKDGKDLQNFTTNKFDYNFTSAGQYQLFLTVEDNQNITSDQCTLNFVMSPKDKDKYMTCDNNRCVEKEGSKDSTCSDDDDCKEDTYTTCDYAKQQCVVKEGDKPDTCDNDSDCKPVATKNPVPETGAFDDTLKAAIVSAASLIIIGLLLIL